MRPVAIIAVLLLAGALTLATCGTAHASGSGWYVDAARLLRQCGRVMAARSAESKARRARKGVFD